METGSVSSVPSSISNSSARSTPVSNPGTFKPITQSASLLALAKSSDDEMRRRNPDELLQIIRRLEAENRNVVSDVNKKMQILLLEVRGMKDINQNLQDDNQELRDLCCFLDDDRQRGRKLAREWQRFGRYTASVMRSEVSAYQEKLKELETKQQELITDNLDLKELCLYLDQERLRASQPRDEGDGSSSSTIAGNEDAVQNDIELVPLNQLNNANSPDTVSATNSYIRQLEDKVRYLETEKRNTTKPQTAGKHSPDTHSKGTPQVVVTGTQRTVPDGTQAVDTGGGSKGTSPNKPEAVVHAMKVLEVHENLERPQMAVGEDNTLDDKEKAIVREMCNVVWRKLGNVKAERQEAQQASQPPTQPPTQPPVYENIKPVRSKSTPPDNYKQSTNRPPGVDRYSTVPDQMSQSMTDTTDSGNQPTPYIQRSDNSRGHTVFKIAPNHAETDPRKTTDFPVQYKEVASSQTSQRPPPNVYNQAQAGQPPGNYGNPYQGQGRYGQVQTTRSTPVTPTPQQQSQRMDPRSHSPGPVRRTLTPRASDMPLTPDPNRMPQYPRSEVQSYSPSPHVYQNQPPKVSGNNSYENVPLNPNYSNSRPQPSHHSHNHSQDSYLDFPPATPNAFSQNSYLDHSSGKPSRPSTSSYQVSQNQRQHANSQSPPYYQNMPLKPNNPTREPQDSHYTSRNDPGHSLPQYSGHRTPSSSHPPSYPPSSHPLPTYTATPTNVHPTPPEYNAPPQYNDRRTSYIEARDNSQPFDEGRNIERYYR